MSKKLITERGTPCAAAWDADWIALVERVESELDRRICGAVGMDGSPCPRESDHPTGRCTHHGGNHLVGGQPGNENARVHGLYSRRLMTCDDRCAMWKECPFAADDIMALSPKQRSICVYEQLEYDALVAQYIPSEENGDCTKQSESQRRPRREPSGDGTVPAFRDTAWKKSQGFSAKPHLHLVHTVALLQVMMSRAATVVSTERFTEKTSASGENYKMESSKVSASLEAFLRLAREHRQYHRELTHTVDLAPEPKPLSLAMQVLPLLERADGVLEDALEFERKRKEKLREQGLLPPPGPGAPLEKPMRTNPIVEDQGATERCRRTSQHGCAVPVGGKRTERSLMDACATTDAAEGDCATTEEGKDADTRETRGGITLPRDQGHVPTCPPRKTVEVELDPTGEPDETMDMSPPPGDPKNPYDPHRIDDEPPGPDT